MAAVDVYDSEPVTEEQYQRWLSSHAGGSDFEDDVEEVVMDELVGAFTNALAGLFGGGSAKKTVNTNAFDAETLNEDLVRHVFADMDACEQAFDIDGIMKHISKSLKGTVTSTIDGNKSTMPLTHSLYRMSLKLVLKEDAEYESEQEINDIRLNGGSATVTTMSATKFVDPLTDMKMNTTTADEFKLEIVDGKVQITGIDSKELDSNPA